ncbi:MAG: UMP kinase [Candidatus Kariarchaeaceae archaeon]|jgi:uridylate kinase
MKIILKIGGSILFKNDEISLSLLQRCIAVIRKLREQGISVGIVIGGGTPARTYAKIAKELGANAAFQDFLGIGASRQNARLFIAGLPEAYPHPPPNYRELIAVSAVHPLVITGGFQPGQSTNAVAALFAEQLQADYLFNLSNVKKVYDKDPAKFNDAQPFDTLSYDELATIIKQNEQSPGKYALFDTLGIEVVKRSSIPLVFIDGHSPEEVLEFIDGNIRGTLIK